MTTPPDAISEPERVALEAECVRQHGFDAWSDGPALIVDEGSPDQAEAAEQAVAQCMDEIEHQYPRQPVDLSSNAARTEFYELLLDTRECLQDLGMKLDQPPSLQTFLDGWGDGGVWHPYNEVLQAVSDHNEWEDVNNACPQPLTPFVTRVQVDTPVDR